jgi:UDP-N-acetylglucosamine--N-acetylmuramyl-(pentapeptide) pyrophosphoryl-undecaprenol N-acetylglucosamine transferase
MKILLTGGGDGGHFQPIVAIVEEINNLVKENRLLRPEVFYMSTTPSNPGILYENNIQFVKVSAGKIRKKFSIPNLFLNILDAFKTASGILGATWKMFVIYPDVVFGKGGYYTFPALFAARILRIPVIIHESDSQPGKVNAWAGKFAKKVAIAYPDAAKFFKKEKTAYTGLPIRKEVVEPLTEGAYKILGLMEGIPTIAIFGGSQGARFINEVIMDALPQLVEKYQIIHQTGKNNIKVIEETRNVILQGNPHKDRYKPIDYLNVLNLRASAGVADIIVSRAGSAIFEIASWAKPAIIIPIPEPTSHDQRTNAYSYARSGAAIVIEEKNLTGHVLISEIDRILDTPGEKEKMAESAKAFARRDSARLIAQEILALALEHDK